MPNRQRAQAARTIIAKCLALAPDSEVALVSDETTWVMARLLADAAIESNCRPLLMFFSQAFQQNNAPDSLGESVKAALREVAATVLCVNGSAACLPFRDVIRRTAWGRGRKVAHMPGATWRSFLIADADYEQITRRCEGLALALAKGNEIVIQSFDRAHGEHILRAQLKSWERLPIISDGIIRPGAWGNVPSGETYIAPVEGTAEGEIVINGSLPGMILAPNHELVLEFHAGRLERVSPGNSRAARHLSKTQIEFATGRGDWNWSNLAEIGLGTHEGIRRLTGSPLLDEKKYGSVHIALGDNMDMGGLTESVIHCDMVCLRPKVWIDDRLIIANGKIVLDEADWREDYRALELPADWRADAFVKRTVIEADVDGEQRLRRYWDTSAGGMCSVPVGDDVAARHAATVWQIIKENGSAIQIPELFARWQESQGDSLDRRDLDRVVRVLEIYGLVQRTTIDGEQEG
ncbi:MAG: aminopeptidase [Chloroflexi bacterium]|nr:aminopeptidase [Chloroflexota bacterium]